MNRILLISFFVFTILLSLVPISEAFWDVKAKKKKCVLVEADVMKRDFEKRFKIGTSSRLFVFDIRPYRVAVEGREVKGSRMISYQDLERDEMYEMNWKGAVIYLVGHDAKSAKNFCRVMVKKDFVQTDIYVLKGGIDKWKGPVMDRFEDVMCKTLSFRQLMKIEDSGKKIEYIDLRGNEKYDNAHIPKAVRGNIVNSDRLYFNEQDWLQIVRDDGFIVFIGNNEQHAMHRCRSAKRANGYDILYVLKGNMKGWEGSVEKERIEIWKRKLKELLGYEKK